MMYLLNGGALRVLMFLSLILFSSSKEPDSKVNGLKQSEKNLLGGTSLAVAYSGFRHGQHPDRGEGAVNPSEAEILEDLDILTRNSNFPLIRLYDSRENSETVLKLIRKHGIEMKVMLGIWLKAEISNHEGCPWLTEPIPDEQLEKNKLENRLEIQNGIRLANEYDDIIIALNVGNEALVSWNDHMVEVDSVISYIEEVKNSISQKVTVAENYDWWIKSGSELAKVVDFLAVHTYPVWEDKDIDEGLSFTIENMKGVSNALPNIPLVIAEAGWATIATEFGERASEEKQLYYYKELTEWCSRMNITLFWFEAFDEDWKGNPDDPNGAEKHWGLFTVDRKAKLVMRELYPDLK